MRIRTCFLLFLIIPALLCAEARASRFDLQTAGQVVVHSKSGAPWITSTSGAWADMPGMKGAVTLPRGGDLSIAVSLEGEISAGSTTALSIRALVGGQLVAPYEVDILARMNGGRAGTYTFYKKGLSAGTHLVKIQWRVIGGGMARLGDRSMVLRFATAASNILRMTGGLASSTNIRYSGWHDIPGLAGSVDCPWDTHLVITVAGGFRSTSQGKLIFLRALVDGKAAWPGNTVIVDDSVFEGMQSFTFHTDKLAKGKHQVQIQWMADSSGSVHAPSFTVTALPYIWVFDHVGLLLAHNESAFKYTTSTAFQAIPGAGGYLPTPTRGDVVIRFAADTYVDKNRNLTVRALLDGKVMDPKAVTFAFGDDRLTCSREAVFVARNVERGLHQISIQWAVSGGKAGMGDWSLAATAVTAQQPLLVTGMESTRPPGYKYGGKFSSSVVEVRNGKRCFRPYVSDSFFRASRSVSDWFQENAKGKYFLVEAAVIGPNLKMYDEKYYREQITNPYTRMKIEAFQKADGEFDFSCYDRDGDGKVKPDELAGLVIFYQDSTFGEVRSIPVIPTNDGVTLDFSSGVATAYTPDFKADVELGLFAHELCHLLINAGDMYENGDPTAPGPYSMMDQHSWFGHLDPLHKLKAGNWFDTWDVSTDGYVVIKPVSEGGRIFKLQDKNSHTGEYFLVESRQKTGYDVNLPADGLAIWHCDEKRLPNWRTAVEIEPSCGPSYKWADYLFSGRQMGFHKINDFWDRSPNTNSKWHDTTPSRIGVWAIQRLDDGSNNMMAYLDVPGPGVLAQVEHRQMAIDPFGRQTLRIRVVNTGSGADSFKVTVNVAGEASWRDKMFSLNGYQTTILELEVKPVATGFTAEVGVAVESLTNTAVKCSDRTTLHYTLRTIGNGCPGCTVTLDCNNPGEANRSYAMGAAFGSEPGTPIPGVGLLPLTADSLLFNHSSMPWIFQKFLNKLDSSGKGQSSVAIPGMKELKGLSIYCAYATYDTNIRTFSNAVKIDIN